MFEYPTLGFDVLLIVLEHLSRQSDVARMSRASKALRATSIRHLLRFGVTVSTEEHLASFVSFLHGDLSHRAPQVRKLYSKVHIKTAADLGSDFEDLGEIDDRGETKEALRLLCETLRMATALEDFSIDSCEEILKRQPGVLKAIVALEKLRRLQVSSVGELTASLIEDIKSPLVEIHLHCCSNGMDQPDDPVAIARRHYGTLGRLSASYAEVLDDEAQFPHLRALALRRITSFDGPTLRKVFPNLTYLELSPGTDYFENAEELRESSLEEPVEGSWSALQHLCGGLDALYGVGITQAVKRVDVDDFTLISEHIPWLHAVVRDTSPSRLLLHIGYDVEISDVRQLRRLLAVPEASNISHLMLDLCLSPLKASPEALMNGLLALLSPLSTSFFVLRLNKFVQSDKRASSRPRKCNWRVYQAFLPPAHEALVRQLAAACRRLQHISFDVMGHAPTYWAVTRADGDVGVSRLDPLVGRELVHREGLWFNNRSMGLSEYI